MDLELVWSDGIEIALNRIKDNSLVYSEYHTQNYHFFKVYLKYFRVPTIILSGLNSVFSVGLQPYILQDTISVLCCSISLVCGIIASLELFVGIQNIMDQELVSSKDFYILYADIHKTLSIERPYRYLNGKIYLDNMHTKYCNLIEQSNLVYKHEKLDRNLNVRTYGINPHSTAYTLNVETLNTSAKRNGHRFLRPDLKLLTENVVEEGMEYSMSGTEEHAANDCMKPSEDVIGLNLTSEFVKYSGCGAERIQSTSDEIHSMEIAAVETLPDETRITINS